MGTPGSLFTPNDWLIAEYARRKRKNPSYSLRSFSRNLGFSPSTLSDFLSKKRALTPKAAKRIASSVFFSESERSTLLRLVEAEASIKQTESKLKALSKNVPGYQVLPEEKFRLIAEWEYYALLSLMETDDFRNQPSWMAKRLGISLFRLNEVLKNLLREGLVKKEGKKYLVTNGWTTSPGVLTEALKKAHQQNLAQAMEAIYSVAPEDKDITSITIALDPEKISLAKEIIKSFRWQMAALLESGSKKEVYNLNIQLVPVTRKRTQ